VASLGRITLDRRFGDSDRPLQKSGLVAKPLQTVNGQQELPTGGQHPADGQVGATQAERKQLALDPAVAPTRVLDDLG
jgi:hypothetical protein